jgi:hypothetical protein
MYKGGKKGNLAKAAGVGAALDRHVLLHECVRCESDADVEARTDDEEASSPAGQGRTKEQAAALKAALAKQEQ